MLDIHFEINGRRIAPNKMADALEAAMYQEIKDSIADRVKSVRCPEHGGRPTITIKGRNIESLKAEITGCCDNLINEVRKKLE